jgi:hypothetical protein
VVAYLLGSKTLSQVQELITATCNNVDFDYFIDGAATTAFNPYDILGIRNRVIAGRNAGTDIDLTTLPSTEEVTGDSSGNVSADHSFILTGGAVVVDPDDPYLLRVKIGLSGYVSRVEGTSVISPIILDLDGDGRISASGGQWMPHPSKLYTRDLVAFDIEGTGFERLVEWVRPGDGLLCTLNEQGMVDGSTLFGTVGGYDNGYEKLSLYDKNNDKIISGSEMKDLHVWQDTNRNGVADPGEVKSCDEMGITSIGLKHNQFKSAFVMNGKTGMAFDWWPNALNLVRLAKAQ